MKIASYLKPVVSDIEILNDVQLCANISIDGNKKFNILTNGTHNIINKTDYITPNDNEGDDYLKIDIKPIGGSEIYTIFDGKMHGYDNLFCDQHTEIKRPTKLFEFEESSIFTGIITLGYNIDYEDEKEDYDVDDEDMVEVFNRNSKIPWQQVKEEGYDYINIIFTYEKGNKIEVDLELA